MILNWLKVVSKGFLLSIFKMMTWETGRGSMQKSSIRGNYACDLSRRDGEMEFPEQARSVLGMCMRVPLPTLTETKHYDVCGGRNSNF